jgi:hypothetical protein
VCRPPLHLPPHDCCSSQLNAEWLRHYFPDASSLSVNVEGIRADGDADLKASDFTDFRIPHCVNCSIGRPHSKGSNHTTQTRGLVKPTVVFFGGSLDPHVRDAATKVVEEASGMLLLGTSAQVRRASQTESPVSRLLQRPTCSLAHSRFLALLLQEHRRVLLVRALPLSPLSTYVRTLILDGARFSDAATGGAFLLAAVRTAAQVFSAYRLCRLAVEQKALPLAIVNIGPTRADHLAELTITGMFVVAVSVGCTSEYVTGG